MEKPSKVRSSPTTAAAKEAAAALRAQLQVELQSIKQCAYRVYECTQLTLDGYNYCLRHILQDKNAPFKQCAYVYNNNGKRCHLPAPKDKKDNGYCNEHALKTHLTNSKRVGHYQPPRTAEALLNSVTHYIRKPRSRTVSSSTQCSDEDHNATSEEKDGLVTKCLDPFIDIDSNSILATDSKVLDMCSESESDVDAASYGAVWHDAHAESSDNDSIDSEQEDVLKHANVYSAEEITSITKDKLIRLQSLYIDQYRYLHYLLKERRRKYLFALKREKETCCSIANQKHDNPKEQRLYKKLKAYNSYHRKHGVEAVCNKRLHERRLKITDGTTFKPHSFGKCVFTEGGVKCGERALPVTRYCRKHILKDPHQVLFRACGKTKADVNCTTPIETIFDDATCQLHMDIPSVRTYSQLRKDSESDYDESMEQLNNLVAAAESQNLAIQLQSSSSVNPLHPGEHKLESIKEDLLIMDNSAPMNIHESKIDTGDDNMEKCKPIVVDKTELMQIEEPPSTETLKQEPVDCISTLSQTEANIASEISAVTEMPPCLEELSSDAIVPAEISSFDETPMETSQLKTVSETPMLETPMDETAMDETPTVSTDIKADSDLDTSSVKLEIDEEANVD